jgi:diguanylate cyclase (GGDEF)-like protein
MLCYLDLDRFKIVNDSSGHLAGDSMLRDVAKLLRDQVRDSDTVARLGGDEFGMLLVGCPLDKARQIADDVCRVVSGYRFVWHDRVFNVGVSIGLIELGREAGTVEQLLAAADSACYVAKKQGAGRVSVYSARDEALARGSGEIEWLQKLQGAIKEERFALYYQPIVAAYGSDTEGPSMEVLLRMLDESGHEIAPGEFVQAAERFRLMASVDRWVVQTTLQALARNAFQLARDRCVAINISGQTLGDPQFLEFVVECLDSTGVSPGQVCFEISESAVISNLENARRFVGVLHGMGCKFTIDDFGSGVGSFSSLKNLELDYLKLDGSFMRNLARDTVSQTMVTAMIKLARTLNFKIIAEQVEDSAALDVARKMGVDFVQGFVIARPTRLALAA